MDSIIIYPYTDTLEEAWDSYLQETPMGTFLHSRRFLSYHQDRFEDVSLVLKNGSDEIIGLFPAALHKDQPGIVCSHPGITFGGILHEGKLQGTQMINALNALTDHYRKLGFQWIQYKAVPWIYFQRPAMADLYALFRIGAQRYRCDLSCTVKTDPVIPKLRPRRRRALKIAAKNELEIIHGGEDLVERFWPVLEENLARKYQTTPVHTLPEIKALLKRFPDNIHIVMAQKKEDQILAGTLLFIHPTVVHAQYICASEAGYACSALDSVFNDCIKMTHQSSRLYFDFGTSNADAGQKLIDSIYEFKAGFGGGGVAHEYYQWRL